MSARRFTFTLCALFALPAVSSAGPIEFNYTVTVTQFPYPNPYSPGELQFMLTTGGNSSWPETGGSVELGLVRLGPSPGPLTDDTYTAYATYSVNVAITDGATGWTRDMTLYGTAVDDWLYRSWDGRWLNTFHELELGDRFNGNTDSRSIEIGRTQYTLTVKPEDGNQGGVYTLSAITITPEPGTLALAALGFAPLALRRLRRMW